MEENRPHQIIITTRNKDERQKFPVNLLVTLAAGAITGVAAIFGLFWGIEVFLGF
jgi:hypothetical protein